MATSPNYSWPEPDNTDLVKNGALAMRTLGNAIDTTMATMTPKSTVTAKGSLIAATAASTPANLAVGNNGETLVADSSTATGLRYQSAYNGNGVINGGMDIWQRGTSFALTGAGTAYTADRWLGRQLGTNVTYSQQTSGLTGIQYSLRIQRPNGTTGTNDQFVYYQFETADSYRFAGQTVTLSFWAKAGANFSATSSVMSSYVYSGTGTNQNITSGAYTGQATVASQNNTLTTSWQRFSVTGTVGSTATQIAIIFGAVPTGTAGANDWYEITGVQLELGSVATSFKRSAGGTIQGELAACRYYYSKFDATTASGNDGAFSTGVIYSSTVVIIPFSFPQMRTRPSFTASGTFELVTAGAVTACTPAGQDITNFSLSLVPNASGLTAGGAALLRSGTSAGVFELSAEL